MSELSRVVIARGRHNEGVRLMAVAKTIHAALGMQLDTRVEQERETTLDLARHALGRAQVERLLVEGAAMDMDAV